MDGENSIERARATPPGRLAGRVRPAIERAEGRAVTIEAGAADLRAYWQVLRKRRWAVLTLAFVVFTVVLLATLKQKPMYRAQAMLEIQRESPEIPTVQALFELETVSDTHLETQYRVLKSDHLARRVIQELRLNHRDEFNPPPAWWSPARLRGSGAPAPTESAERTLENFQKRLGVMPVKRSRLVSISFEAEDADLAARAVNTLAANYIEQSLEARWQATQKASEWLAQQLQGLQAKLEKSEDELQAYAREHGLLFLESEKGHPENIVNERLRQLQEELTKAQAARYERESLYRLVESGDFASLPGVFDSQLMQDLTVRLAELRREHAQLIATFTPAYPRVREVQSQLEEVEAVLERERQRGAQRITNDYRAARARERYVEQAFAEQQRRANQIAEQSVQYNILKREVDTTRQLYEGLLQRLKEAGVSAGLKASNIRIVDAAVPPLRPATPRVLLNLSLGLFGGLLLGVGGALLQEHLDNTLKTSEDVERFLRVPALGLIPSAESLNGHRHAGMTLPSFGRRRAATAEAPAIVPAPKWVRIDAGSLPHNVLPEAFCALRTSVLLSTAGSPPRTLLVTSAQIGEGKTTVATNLAISLAQLGHRVLLVDCDLRRPSAHKVFGRREPAGLVSYLTGQQVWRACVRPTGLGGLDALFCGPVPPNPAELLSSERMGDLVTEAAAEYGFVVFDSAPLMNLADSRILATLPDGVMLVVKSGFTRRELSRRALDQLEDVGANVIGVVVNNLEPHHAGDEYYYSYYGYQYGEKSGDASARGQE